MRISIGLIFLFSFQLSWAQKTDCLQVLTQAESEFNAGHFYGLSSVLQECLENNGFTNEQKVRAYILLSQAYLLSDDPIAAEDSYLRLLKADPEYVADEVKDPVDVYYLSKKFTATPRFTPTLFRGGTNISFVRIIHKVNTNSTQESSVYKDRVKLGFQVGSGIDWNMNDNFSIGAEVNFAQRSFQTTGKGIFNDDELLSTEKQFWFDIPVYVKYGYHLGKIRPFGYVGVSMNLLVADQVELEYLNRTLIQDKSSDENRTQGPDVNLKYKRNTLNQSIVFGGGLRYKIGKDFVVVDARYIAGLTNITNVNRNFYESKSNDNYEMAITTGKYSFIGDYFRLDNLSLSIGYVKPLYDPRKIKKARTRSAMKQISKQKADNE